MKVLLSLLILPILSFAQIQFSSSEIVGGVQEDAAKKIKMDEEGNLFVIGIFTGPATFGTNTFSGSGFSDCYLQKINSNNEILWTNAIGGPNIDLVLTLAIDAYNNIWVSGRFTGSIDLDPSTNEVIVNSDPDTGSDCFLACYNGQTGAYITHKDISSGGILEIRTIEFTPNQQVIIGGAFQYTVDFDFSSNTLFKTSFVNSYDGFVASYSSNFEVNNWVNVLNSINPAYDYVNDLEILNNKIYLTGLLASTMDIDPGNGTFQISGATDAFLISYNVNNGNLNWGFKIGGNSLDIGNFVSVINNTIYLNGTINSDNVDFNPTNATNTLSANGLTSPPFVAKYDTLGNYNSAYLLNIAPTGTYSITQITTADNNEILISGYFKGNIDIDPSTDSINLSSPNVNNSFFMRLNENDSLLDYKYIQGSTENVLNDIIYNQGKVIAIGSLATSCNPDQSITLTVNALFSTNKDAFIFTYGPLNTNLNTINSFDLSIFPNPVNEFSIIKYNKNLIFDIFDFTGKKYGNIEANNKNELFKNLPVGLYFAVQSEKKLYIKFLKN